MPHSKSAKKRMRQNTQRKLRNRRRKSAAKGAVRALDEAIGAGDREQAAGRLKQACRLLDKTAAKGAMHKRAAARKKSRLAAKVNNLK